MATSPRKPVRQFADFLGELQRGAVMDQASAGLAELVNQVRAVGKKGTLTIAVTVEPFTGNDTTLKVAADVVVKAPKSPSAAGVFFPDETGNLHRNDPHQPMLPLNDLPAREEKDLRP